MSLITRCPACQTLFQVVPDQLRISEGWVRCGQCKEVFDAALYLSTPATPAIPQLPLQSALPVAVNAGADTQVSAPEAGDVTELSDVSFLRHHEANYFGSRPGMRMVLVLLSLLLLVALPVQIVFHERDRIVASEPGLKSGLQAICKLLNCSLSPLRRIESIVIESSSFIRIRTDTYRLNLMVKNTAVTALAVPAIELALTDALDQPIVRRVFLAAELGAKSDTLAAGAEWPASIALTVKTAGMTEQVAGYRLLAFYP